jgi:hypothetical protein
MKGETDIFKEKDIHIICNSKKSLEIENQIILDNNIEKLNSFREFLKEKFKIDLKKEQDEIFKFFNGEMNSEDTKIFKKEQKIEKKYEDEIEKEMENYKKKK